jgi:hypothetical protein
MNADGSTGVSADVKVGGMIDHVVPVALGVTGGGLLILLFGVGVIVAGRGGKRRAAAVPVTA